MQFTASPPQPTKNVFPSHSTRKRERLPPNGSVSTTRIRRWPFWRIWAHKLQTHPSFSIPFIFIALPSRSLPQARDPDPQLVIGNFKFRPGKLHLVSQQRHLALTAPRRGENAAGLQRKQVANAKSRHGNCDQNRSWQTGNRRPIGLRRIAQADWRFN